MRGDLTTRKTRTASGSTAVQVVRHEGKRRIGVKHIGSARDQTQLEALVVPAEQYAEAHHRGGRGNAIQGEHAAIEL